MPVHYFNQLGESFVYYLLEHIENPLTREHERDIVDVFIGLMLSYNLQFKDKSPHRQMFEEQKQCKGFYRTGTKVIWKKFWRKIIFGMRQKHFWSTDNKRPLKFHLVIGVIMCFSTSMGGGRDRLCKKLALFNGRQSCSWSHKQILEYSNCNILD